MAENFMQTLSSFSGADLIVFFGNRPIAELQSISWGIQREKTAIYTLGSPDPRSFSRGKRGIAGQLIFLNFDRDALLEEMKKQLKGKGNMPVMFTAAGNAAAASRTAFEEALSLTAWNDRVARARGKRYTSASELQDRAKEILAGAGNPLGDYSHIRLGNGVNVPWGFDLITPETILYPDTLPPFDITCTFANEYGQAAYLRILDVEILNEGSGVSVDSMVMERAMTYIARRISPITQGAFTGTFRAPGS